ncbi:Mitochodrial transcription termination factor [Trema orientale]|uniref:Mitochodrial transcription termination factor n=1 Tax=Trema orientale TaxID=63057 RepID=A0A2P5DFV6_TREOI|nr:Mitochodrial transcription termination factor [Trema orientale]
MFRLICKRLSLVNSRASKYNHGFCLSKSFLRHMTEVSSFTDPRSFTLSYLQNSCGLSQNSALTVSKRFLIEDSEKADSVLKLMRTHGLTQSHIEKIIGTRPTLLLVDVDDKLRPNMELFESLGFSGDSLGKMLSKDPRMLDTDLVDSVEFFKGNGFSDKQMTMMIMKRPQLLFFNANKTFKPKLDFFKSVGFTDEDVAKILSSEPYILERSLENRIIRSIEVLKRVVGADEDVVKAVKGCYWILEYNLEEMLEPNISMLKSHGVPERIILRWFLLHPKTLLLRPQRITEILAEVVKLGFNPNTSLFVLAFRSMAVMSKTLWEQKVEAYKSFGLSKDQVYSAFKSQPMFMLTSEKKIKKMMNFYINKLKMEPSVICRSPNILLYSLEKRIIPRSSVLQLLMSTGYLKEANILYYLRMSEKQFVEKLVRKFQVVLPDVVKAYEGKIEFQGLPVLLKS